MSKTTLSALLALLATAACSAPGGTASDQPSDVTTLAAHGSKKKAPAADHQGTITGVEYHGDGCPANANTTGISGDGEAVTSVFSAFFTSAGDGTSDGDQTRACLLDVKVDVPAGWQYRLNAADVRGYADLDSGVTGTRSSTYLIIGSAPIAPAPAHFSGGTGGADYGQRDVAPDSPAVWSPCGRGQDLWIGVNLSLDGPATAATSTLTIDSIDNELAWRTCQ
jgi:hypothetical protein